MIIDPAKVLGHLRVIDLYHMSLASKNMRALVMSDPVRPMWKRAFEQDDRLIAPHSSVSEAKWASLLFGPLICSVSEW